MTEALRFERVLPAPRAVVFRAFTEPAMIRRWMCPETYGVAEAEAEPEPGGRFRVTMQGPEGERYTAVGAYVEVRAPEVVEFTWEWLASHTMAGVETRIRVELAARGARTLMVMTHSGLPSAEEREGHRRGWTGALGKLEKLMEEEG